MARNTLIMVDIDSTLYDANMAFQEVAKGYGFEWPADPGKWIKGRDLGITGRKLTEFFDHVHSHEIVSNLKPYPNALDCLVALQKVYPVDYWYVSNRSPDKHDPLLEWLDNHNFPQADHVSVSRDKKKWIARFKPDFVIDDRINTLVFARYHHAICLALLQSWNQNLQNDEIDGIYIFEDWWKMEIGLDHLLKEWHS